MTFAEAIIVAFPLVVSLIAIMQARSSDINKAVETINLAYQTEKEMRIAAEERAKRQEALEAQVEELVEMNQSLRKELAREQRLRRKLANEVEALRAVVYGNDDTGPINYDKE